MGYGIIITSSADTEMIFQALSLLLKLLCRYTIGPNFSGKFLKIDDEQKL